MSGQPEFVLVRGVVYQLLRTIRRRDFDYSYHRRSVPPEMPDGTRSKWPPVYAIDKLPDHEVISEEQAVRIKEASRG